MPRRKRSYLPGCAFHITARTHSGEYWFEELRSEIVAIIGSALKQTDALLLAYTIMTNHIYLVIRQGDAPLAQLMHPVGQRTAYAVHRRCKRSGYVLGYRYFDVPCRDEALQKRNHVHASQPRSKRFVQRGHGIRVVIRPRLPEWAKLGKWGGGPPSAGRSAAQEWSHNREDRRGTT